MEIKPLSNFNQISPSQLSSNDKEKLKSKEYRLNTLYKIIDKQDRMIPFVLNRAQNHFLANRAKRNIILKSRRLGMTTFAAIDELDDSLWNKNFETLLLSYDEPSSIEIFQNIVQLSWENYPFKDWYVLDASRANKLRLGFKDPNGIITFSSLSVKSSGRGGRFSKIHISEFGKICAKYPAKATEIVRGTINALKPDGELTIESTAEGDDNDFADMFWEAYNRPKDQALKPTELKAFFYNWQWDDWELQRIRYPDAQIPKEFREIQREHNEKAKKRPDLFSPLNDIHLTYYFYKWIQNNRDWNSLHQEFPITPEDAFISSGSKLFDPISIDNHRMMYAKEGRQQGDWVIYEDFKFNHRSYVLAADPSEGVGADHSAAAIMDFSNKRPKVVATYKNNKIPPDLFAFEIKAMASLYGTALIAVERNNTGHATLTQLKQIYPEEKIFKEVKEDKYDPDETERLGWLTTLSSKPRMFYDLVSAMNNNEIEVPSNGLLHEMRVYGRQNLNTTKADPNATNHFDMLTALAICYQMKSYLDDYTVGTPTTYSSRLESKENEFGGI